MSHVVLVDDHPSSGFAGLIESWGIQVVVINNCSDIQEAILVNKPNVLICNQSRKNSCVCIQEHRSMKTMPVIIIEHGESIEQVVQFMKLGVYDYFINPVDEKRLFNSVFAAIEENNEKLVKIEKMFKDDYCLPGIIGNSPLMQRLADKVKKIAPSATNIMIIGETGTGKELVAQNIHNFSERSKMKFSPVDCSVLNSNLLESELFGYEKGAFTGAEKTKPGLFEIASGGTVFLDEITELDFNMQSKLLRAIQDKAFRRIGGRTSIHYDVRFISATNRNPQIALKDKKLRNDLFFRLNVVSLEIPPLRKRTEDIPTLLDFFIKKFNFKHNKHVMNIPKDLLGFFVKYNWPGNVRELENVVEQMIIFSEDSNLSIHNLPQNMCLSFAETTSDSLINLPYNEAKTLSLNNFCREYFKKMLVEYNGNISRVAKASQMSRKSIYQILHELKIR